MNIVYTKIIKAVHFACLSSLKDENIIEIISSNLTGACAIASFGVYEKLILKGYFPDFVYGTYNGKDHCWVVADETILDATYLQFDSSNPIFIGKSKKYKPCLTNKDAIDYLWLWGPQSPKHYYFKWINDSKCKLHYNDSLLELI